VLEQEYGGGVGNTAAALLTGGARGLTLGLSDLALNGVLDDDGQFALEQLRLRNEIASTAGEIGGALAPALFTGGSGLLGAAARFTPAGALTRAGASVAARVGGETVAASALRGAMQAGIEGAGMGLGNSITQAALHDDPFTVESVAANIALGGVLGGVTGGLLGAGGAVARRALSKATPLSATTPVDELALGLRKVSSKADELVEASTAATMNTAAGKELRAAQSRLQKELGDELDLGQLFAARGERAEGIVDNLDKFVRAAGTLDDSVGQRFGVKLDIGEEALRQKLAATGPDFVKAMDAIPDGKLAEAIGKGGNEKALAWVANLTPEAKLALRAFAVAGSQTAEEATKRGWLSNLIVSSATGAGRNAIPSGVRGAGMFSSIARGAARNVGGFIGSKVGRMAAGAAGGYAVGGKEGALSGAAFGAGASGSTSGRIGSMAAKAVAALSKPITAKALTAASILGATKFGQDSDKDPARARMKEIAAAVSSPTTRRAIQTATLPLHLQNPAVGEKVQAALEMRLGYLAERNPWRPPQKAFRSFKAEVQPSRYEVAKWARVVRAAEDPLTLLDDLENRRLTPEAINTVKDLYPEVFSRLQVAVMEQVSSMKEGMSYQARLQVATFFDTPVDASQTPEFGATIQGLYGQSSQSQPQPRGSLGTPEPAGTQTQRLTSPM
jgi:hypothetical protein